MKPTATIRPQSLAGNGGILHSAAFGSALATVPVAIDLGSGLRATAGLFSPTCGARVAIASLTLPLILTGALLEAGAGFLCRRRGAWPRWLPRLAVIGRIAVAVCGVVAVGATPAVGLQRQLPSGGGGGGRAPSSAPNVLLVIVNLLRANVFLDGDKEHGQLMPGLDRLAERGWSFGDATSPSSWTQPAVAGIFTERHPFEWNAHFVPLPEEATTLAETFRSRGWATAGFSDNYIVSHRWGFDQGFEEFAVRSNVMTVRELWLFQRLNRMNQARVTKRFGLMYRGGDRLAEDVSRFLDQRPLFLFVHLVDAHFPFYVHSSAPGNVSQRADPRNEVIYQRCLSRVWSEPFVDPLPWPARRKLRNMWLRYLAGVQRADQEVSRIVARAEGHSGGRGWISAVVGDHGEEFFEHGLFSHGVDLYQEVVHVPLVIGGSDHRPGFGSSVDAPVSTIALGDAVLHLAGIRDEVPAMVALAEGRPASSSILFSELVRRNRRYVAARHGAMKTIRTQRPGLAPVLEVFDLAVDPGEREPLPVDLAPHAIREALERFGTSANAAAETAKELPDDEWERLRALGYGR